MAGWVGDYTRFLGEYNRSEVETLYVSKSVSKVSIYIAHSRKISNALSTSHQYFAEKVCLQLTPNLQGSFYSTASLSLQSYILP